MKESHDKQIDKSKWGDGPWQTEPDRVEWRYKGFPLLAVRHDELGHWCAYVGVPPAHPWHGKGYDEVDANVHGGLTYAAKCSDHVCHVPEPGETDDVWWLGFDYAHAGDLSPGSNIDMRMMLGIYNAFSGESSGDGSEHYKTLEHVRREAERLADQAVESVGVCR
jgi:hypothetical protein